MKKIVILVFSALLVLAMLPLTALADGAYTVTYNSNGANSGTAPVDSATYSEGDSVSVSANTLMLAKTGFTFRGWNTAADGSGTRFAENSVMTMPGKNVILYAQWTPIACNVRFNSMGGTRIRTWKGNYGDIISTVPTTYKRGFSFGGWYPTKAFDTAAVSFPYTVTGSTVFYAKWIYLSPFLSQVTITPGTLSFSKYKYFYKVQLGENDTSFSLTATPVDSNAVVTINRVKETSATFDLSGKWSYNISVKVKNGCNTRVYTFLVKRPRSSDNTLSALTAAAGGVTFPFTEQNDPNTTVTLNPNTTDYYVRIGADTPSVTISATAASPYARVLPFSSTYKVACGNSKTAYIRVRAQNGEVRLYTVTIIRAQSADANLKSIKAWPWGYSISPLVNSTDTQYTVTIPTKDGTALIYFKTEDKNATVSVNGTSGAYTSVTLAAGESTILKVIVTAQNGKTTKEYDVTVTRASK